MELEYDYWTGTATQVIDSLNRSIGQYLRHYAKVEVGICCNPEQTRIDHCKYTMDWDWMIVKYKTTSKNFVTELKETLKDNNRDCIESDGQGRGVAGNGKHYLYVLLKEHLLI